MRDVARRAGVSTKTVSNVVNNFVHVSEQTRTRVEDAITALGYEVNVTARNLRTGRTGLITLALPDLTLPYFAELADSVMVEAEKAGLRVLIEQTNSSREREMDVLHGVRRHVTDGLIFSPLELGPGDVHLFEVDFPMVLLGERVFGSTNDHITMSNIAAAEAATEHLLAQGCTRIAVVGSRPGETAGSATLREQGYVTALARAGIPVRDELIRETVIWRRGSGCAAMDELISSGIEFDGVFALNDTLALGVLRSLHVHRLSVPQDVAVIGFDDIEDASYTHPTLSSVSPGREEIARQAIRLLTDRVGEAARSTLAPRPHERIYAPFEVIARESSTRNR